MCRNTYINAAIPTQNNVCRLKSNLRTISISNCLENIQITTPNPISTGRITREVFRYLRADVSSWWLASSGFCIGFSVFNYFEIVMLKSGVRKIFNRIQIQ